MGVRVAHLFLITFVLVFFSIIGVSFGQTAIFTYDDLNQLTKAQFPDGTAIEYIYDEVGNRASKVVTKLSDSDNDGLSNDLEIIMGTDPLDADTDDDGLIDGEEDVNHNGVVDLGETDPGNIDSDGDGIQDGTELGYSLADIGSNTDASVFQPDLDPSSTTDPLNSDTDGDGLKDGKEDINHDGKVDSGETNPKVINPVIISIEPLFGKVGSEIKITGANFGDDSQVTKEATFYNNVTATQIISWSDNQIICTVPSGVQSGSMKVVNGLGTSNLIFFSFAIYVPNDYTTIQTAINAASRGDTVVVADGIYKGVGNRNLDFKGKAITVRSENGRNNCIIDSEGSGRGFYFHNAEGDDSIVSGFTIINGNKPEHNGAGIYCLNASPTISDCTISSNTAKWGGGIMCYTSSPTITNCTISGNTADYGGGIYCYKEPSPTITGCIISNNSAKWGGGIGADSAASIIANCAITGNNVSVDGGGIDCSRSSLTITGCTISKNSSSENAGGIYLYKSSISTIINCIISGNMASFGGGIHCYASSPSITNCTISKNSASNNGGGIRCYEYASPTITNCILWNDLPDEISVYSGTPVVTYSDVQGGYGGAGNNNADPLFADSNAENYHLRFESPCIDTGTNVGAPLVDRDGISRPQDGNRDDMPICDIGSYEYDINDPPKAVNDSYALNEGGTINESAPGVLVNDIDAENNALTSILVTGPSHGNLALNADGSFIYVHDGSETLRDSFIYKANDGREDGNIATVSISINALNDAPASVNESYSVNEGGTINQSPPGVLINDTDAENDPLTAILVTNVTHGNLTLSTNGSFIYVHDGSETRSDSFTYKANDGTQDSNIATVTIIINAVNDSPSAINDKYSVDEGGTINKPAPGVLINDTDAESDPLTVVLVIDVSHGSLSLNTDGSFIYVHDGSETVSDSFIYKANDREFGSNIATGIIAVKPINDPPELALINDRTVDENMLLSFTISATDPDGDTLTYSASNLPPGASFNALTSTFTWTPAYDQAGTYHGVHFEVTDGLLSDSETITITVNNVDITPPTTEHNYYDLWHKEDFIIYLTAIDTESNVKATYYRINDGSVYSVSIAGQPVISIEGEDNTLEYWSIDKAGNEELPHKMLTSIKLDKTPPTINILSPEDEAVFSESVITIAGESADALSGIENVEIYINGIAHTPLLLPEGSFSLVDANIVGGPNNIVTRAYDVSGNTREDRVTIFQGWMLHLDIPYYGVDTHYTGAPCAQMVLNYVRDGLANALTQEEIYNYGHLYNSSENPTLSEMDPKAIHYALGHFDPYDESNYSNPSGNAYRGYNFGVLDFEGNQFIDYLRSIIHWMAFPVTIDYWWLDGELVDRPNTPAVVPVFGTYNHWIVVNGASTDQNPAPDPHINGWYTPDFTAYGLWLTDPSSEGIGQDLYVTAQTAQETYFLPLVSTDIHNGKLLQVAEPPDVPNQAEVKIAPPKVNYETLKVIKIAEDLHPSNILKNMSSFEERLANTKRHLYDAALVVDLGKDVQSGKDMFLDTAHSSLLNLVFAFNSKPPIELNWREIVDSALLSDEDFRNAFDGAQARSFVKVRRADKKDTCYYLIPFDKYVKGQFLTYAAIIIDAEDGSFQEASWLEKPQRFIHVNEKKTKELLVSKYPYLQNVEFDVELVWEPKKKPISPFYPYWEARIGSEIYFVTQDGEILKE